MTRGDAGDRPPAPDPGPGESTPDAGVERARRRCVEVLERLLSTEARARIYVQLRQHPGCTSREVGRGTGLYPSTVRETLAAMTEEGLLTREKRERGGAGNNPFEYTAIPPDALVRKLVDGLQADLNTLCNLDHHLEGRRPAEREPVRIEVGEEEGGA